MRLSGLLVGINLVLPSAAHCRVTYLEGDGELGPSFEAVRRHLRSSHSRYVPVGCINDLSALGALRAFQEVGCAANCAISGQDSCPEGRAAQDEHQSRLAG